MLNIITAQEILRMSSRGDPIIINGIVTFQNYLNEADITSPLRFCHFMAQCAVESFYFRKTTEMGSGNAYEGRLNLGNTQPGDGPKFKGHGLIQTTGRANHREATIAIRKIVPSCPDFETVPDQLAEFPWALLSAVIYWKSRNINIYADRDDILAVTRKVNGGTNGLTERRNMLTVAKSIWLDPVTSGSSMPVLRQGDRGLDVKILQNALNYFGANLLVDSIFGTYTTDAVRNFQYAKGLVVDGIVGARTWALLTN